MSRLLTIAEAAQDLKACSRTVHRLIDDGKLPVVELTNSKRGRRINPDDLEEYKKGKVCQLESGAKSGKSTSETVPLASELDELLGLVEQPSKEKQKSGSNSKGKPSLSVV